MKSRTLFITLGVFLVILVFVSLVGFTKYTKEGIYNSRDGNCGRDIPTGERNSQCITCDEMFPDNGSNRLNDNNGMSGKCNNYRYNNKLKCKYNTGTHKCETGPLY